MSDLKLAVPGTVYQLEQSTAQFAILASANAWSAAWANNIMTITTTGAHGLTFSAAAGTLSNFFVTFQGNITAQTGTGTVIGNLFRILTIPSTTTFTIYTTVTALTAATTAGIVPVFIPQYQIGVGSAFSGGPQSGSPLATVPGTYTASANCNFTLGANCVVNYYPDNTSIILDSTTGSTPTTAPTARTLVATSSQGQVWMDGVASTLMVASGTTATSRVSVVE